MDPVIEEICRAREVQPHAFGRWQRYLRDVIQPKLARLADLEEEVERLTAPVPVGRGGVRKGSL